MNDQHITITVSASYGAGGSVIAPQLADRLGLRHLDRAIPAHVAHELSVPIEEALAHDDRSEHGVARLLTAFSMLTPLTGAVPVTVGQRPERDFVTETEHILREAAPHGAVILGRAAAIVLGNDPRYLHVRLDGPTEARIEQASRLGGIDRDEARRQQQETDQARDAYLHHLYRTDRGRAHLYHLTLDSTVIAWQTCIELIETAFHAPPNAHAGAADDPTPRPHG